MSSNLDDKLAGTLAVALAKKPRANLQQIANSAGISKATLYRIAPTREGVIDLLMERATKHLQDAMVNADLAKPPFTEALARLTENVIRGGEFYLFWNSAQWVQLADDKNAENLTCVPSFYEESLENFFLKGQKAGVFRIDMSAKWLVKSYDYLLYAAIESAQRGEVARVGMGAMVTKTFFFGAVEPSTR